MGARTAARVTVDPDGLARCGHRDLFGNVCPTCWAATADLVDLFGQVFEIPLEQALEDAAPGEWLAEAIAAGAARVSPSSALLGPLGHDVAHGGAQAPRCGYCLQAV